VDNPYAPPQSAPSPRAASGPFRLASREKRFAASIIDGLLTAVAGMLAARAYCSLLHVSRTADATTLAMVLASSGNWLPIALRGQSIGKMLLRMRIVHVEDQATAGFMRGVALRALPVAFLSAAPAMFGAWTGPFARFALFIDAIVIFGSRRRCVHDAIAGTEVVDAA
jgi:uncharacterized RDD family membrane protein YckC